MSECDQQKCDVEEIVDGAYEFDWEYLLDAQFTFENGTHINCVFTRVYIDDLELVNMGDMKSEEAAVVAVEQEASNAEQSKSLLPFPTNEEAKPGLGIETAFEKAEREGQHWLQQHPFLQEEKRRKKGCEDLKRRIRKLGYAPGFDDGQDEEQSEKLESKLGELNSVQFEHYPSQFSRQRQFKYAKQSMSQEVENNEADTVSTTITGDEQPIREELTLEQKQHFDFRHDAQRDRALVAKHADRYFAKDKEMMKYWFQRYRFFAKLDKGILMDREGWFSVTPEHIARHVADRLRNALGTASTVLDAFTGMGGNAIQFALKGLNVFAVDIDPLKLRCALQNARVYGVERRITFICGDFFHIAKAMFGSIANKEQRNVSKAGGPSDGGGCIDAVFLSPPWGGPDYTKKAHGHFDLLADMQPDGVHTFRVARRISPNIVYFVPKNTRVAQLLALAGPGGRVELEQSHLNGKVKCINAYYGDLVAPENTETAAG